MSKMEWYIGGLILASVVWHNKIKLVTLFFSLYDILGNFQRGFDCDKMSKVIKITTNDKRVIFLPYNQKLAISKKNVTIFARFTEDPIKWVNITPLEGTPFNYSPDDIEALEIIVNDKDGSSRTYTENQMVKWESDKSEPME